MPLILPAGHPAVDALRREGATVFEGEPTAPFALDVRPLTVALINLMPDKPTTELQFGRLLAGVERPVRLVLTLPNGYEPQTADPAHVERFYRPWSAIDRRRLDGVIITGAPLEHLPYGEVRYWTGLSEILDWLTAERVPSVHVCWAAMAALWHDHGVPKQMLGQKRFGVFSHVPLDTRTPVLRGVPLPLDMPVSRWAEIRLSDLPADGSIRPLALAPVAGLGLAEDPARRALYVLNHPEYDSDTLRREYARDRDRGILVTQPDPKRTATKSWDAAGRTLYRNWLTEIARIDPRDQPASALDLLIRVHRHGDGRIASDARRRVHRSATQPCPTSD